MCTTTYYYTGTMACPPPPLREAGPGWILVSSSEALPTLIVMAVELTRRRAYFGRTHVIPFLHDLTLVVRSGVLALESDS